MESFERLKAQADALQAKEFQRIQKPILDAFERECADADAIVAALGIEGDTRTEGGSLRMDKILLTIQSLFPHGEPPAAAQPAKCLIGEYCQTHRFIHGAEAEELRERIEVLLRTTERESDRDDFEKSSLIAQMWRLLDDVDARDSCAFVEANGEILYPQPIQAVAPAAALSPTSEADFNDGAFGEAAYCHHRHHLNTDDEIATGIVEGEFVGFGKVHTSDFDTCRHSICVAARKSAALSPSEEPDLSRREVTEQDLQAIIKECGYHGDSFNIERAKMMGFRLAFYPEELLKIVQMFLGAEQTRALLRGTLEGWKARTKQKLEASAPLSPVAQEKKP